MIFRFIHRIRPGLRRAAVVAAVAACVLLGPARLSAQSPDATEDIRPPKDMVAIPQEEKSLLASQPARWLAIGGGALLCVLAAWLWRRHRRRNSLRSPAETALWSLAELELLREAIAAEAFANRAADTVRIYLAERFGLAAPRRTTEEFLHDLAQDGNSPLSGHGDLLRAFLKSCDMAKFAALPLDAGQRGDLIRAAREFVAATAAAGSNKQAVVSAP